MKGRPGSSWWLLQHELRMFWFNNGARAKKRSWIVPLLVIGWLSLHLLAFILLRNMPPVPAAILPMIAMAGTAILVVLGTFMFSSGLKYSVDSLFERGDVDLLLSSPLPSRSIFTVRLGAITLTVAGVYLALIAPVVNAGLLLGHAAWLAAYAVILVWASICSALAMLLTLLLVRLLGARKTRVVAQVLSAIAGALLFLLAQAQNIFHIYSSDALQAFAAGSVSLGSALAPGSVLWTPGRAVMGQGVPLLALVTVAIALFFLTVHFTHGFFVRGLQQAASTVRVKTGRTGARQGQFGRHLLEVVLRKEWKLIARDPHLVSQVLLQLLYLLPVGFMVLRAEQAAAPSLAAALVMLAASLASSLTWIVVSGEDAPDLLLASPAAVRIVRLAKLAAAVVPVLTLMAVPLLWSVSQRPLSGLLTCLTVIAATCCAALTGLWQGRAAPRGNFKTRAKANLVGSILELVGSLAWAATGFVLILTTGPGQSGYDAPWAGIGLTVALLTLLLAWGTRRRAA